MALETNDPRPVLRAELAKVFKNQRVIRAFEQIFDLVPPEFINQQTQIDSLTLSSDAAGSQANQAVDAINRLSSALETLALAPRSEFIEDAESGSWTPVDGSGAGLVFPASTGSFSRHGDLVVARARVAYPVTASGAATRIDGLPFTVFNSQDARQGFMSYTDRGLLTYALPLHNSNSINFFDAAGANLSNAAISGRDNYFTAIYKIFTGV